MYLKKLKNNKKKKPILVFTYLFQKLLFVSSKLFSERGWGRGDKMTFNKDERTKTEELGFSPTFPKSSVWHKHKSNVVMSADLKK